MICQQTTDWIWETGHPSDSPPQELASHLDRCEVCTAELTARTAVSRHLRDLRTNEEAELPGGLDRMVLDAAGAATAARKSGDFGVLRPEVEDEFSEGLGGSLTDSMRAMMSGDFGGLDSFDDIADDIAESIAEEYGAEIAALTTGRLQVADGPRPEVLPQSPRGARREAPKADAHRAMPTTPAWQQRALLATLIVGVGSLGFVLGRGSAPLPGAAPAFAPEIHTTIATAQPSSPGNTYLLTGPSGGPYEVVGVVGHEEPSERDLKPYVDSGELLIAIGPAGGWPRGARLAVSDLINPGVEIIERRPLP